MFKLFIALKSVWTFPQEEEQQRRRLLDLLSAGKKKLERESASKKAIKFLTRQSGPPSFGSKFYLFIFLNALKLFESWSGDMFFLLQKTNCLFVTQNGRKGQKAKKAEIATSRLMQQLPSEPNGAWISVLQNLSVVSCFHEDGFWLVK